MLRWTHEDICREPIAGDVGQSRFRGCKRRLKLLATLVVALHRKIFKLETKREWETVMRKEGRVDIKRIDYCSKILLPCLSCSSDTSSELGRLG